MDVGELIDLLSKLPREMRVVCDLRGDRTAEIVHADVRKKGEYCWLKKGAKPEDKLLVLDHDIPEI